MKERNRLNSAAAYRIFPIGITVIASGLDKRLKLLIFGGRRVIICICWLVCGNVCGLVCRLMAAVCEFFDQPFFDFILKFEGQHGKHNANRKNYYPHGYAPRLVEGNYRARAEVAIARDYQRAHKHDCD